jgi:hypothetical protein
MNQNRLKLILGIAAGVLLVLAILLLVFSFTLVNGTATRIVMIISAVLSFVMAALLAYLMLLANDTATNYFLYDSQQKRNIPVAKLTFDTVNIRMNRCLSGYAKSEGKLWTDRILEDPSLDIDNAFKPLVAYKLLYDLAQYDADNGWKCFEYASMETVQFLCDALVMNGDNEMSQTLLQMKSGLNVKCDIKYVRDYIVSNRAYLKDRMFRYVRENIEQF